MLRILVIWWLKNEHKRMIEVCNNYNREYDRTGEWGENKLNCLMEAVRHRDNIERAIKSLETLK